MSTDRGFAGAGVRVRDLVSRVLDGAVRLLVGIGLAVTVGLVMAQSALADITPGSARPVTGTVGLSGVACGSATSCIAVGAGGAGSVVVPLAADGTPGTAIAAQASFLQGVACGTATSCVAVGGTGIGSVVTIDNGTPGTLQTVSGTQELGAVACASASTCLALGSVFPGGEVVVPIVNGTAGAAETLPGPTVALDAIACPTVTSCIAVGAGGVVVPLSPGGTPGTVQTVPGTSDLEGVACPSATSCIAVGASSSGAVVVPLSAGGTPGTVQAVAGTHTLRGVACTSSSCVAVGDVCTGASCLMNNDFAGQVVPVAADGTPGTPITVTGTEDLTGAACTSATSCVAVGANSANGVVVPLGVNAGGKPSNTGGLPTISGTPKAGKTLSCSHGTWSGNPTFAYQWSFDGTPIQGATTDSYTIQSIDEGLTITCTVTASNAGGAGKPATSRGVPVPVPRVARCPGASGKLSGDTLGLLRLGMTRAQALHAFAHSSNRGKKYEDFFCLTPRGVRVGIASPKLVKTLPKSERGLAGHVIWASTSSLYYSVHGIRCGATVAAASKLVKLTGPFHIGLNYWYLAPNGASTAVFKVRGGIIEEIGIADEQLTRGHKAQVAFLTSFS